MKKKISYKSFFLSFIVHLSLFFLSFSFGLNKNKIKKNEGYEIDYVFREEKFSKTKDVILDKNNQPTNKNLSNEKEKDDIIVDKSYQIKNEDSLAKIEKKVSKEISDIVSILNSKVIISNNSSKDNSISSKPNSIDSSIENNYSDGYELGDRNTIYTPKPDYICDKIGKVVMRIWVNKKGETFKAELDLNQTTETSPCLVEESKKAALNTKWLPDKDGEPIQIGKITYNFKRK